jgi:hypothetical protein
MSIWADPHAGGWLTGHGSSLVELDEIAGYHRNRPTRYRAELGLVDEAAQRLAAEAAATCRRLAGGRWTATPGLPAGGRAKPTADVGAARWLASVPRADNCPHGIL